LEKVFAMPCSGNERLVFWVQRLNAQYQHDAAEPRSVLPIDTFNVSQLISTKLCASPVTREEIANGATHNLDLID
jgi:hypothetical protein